MKKHREGRTRRKGGKLEAAGPTRQKKNEEKGGRGGGPGEGGRGREEGSRGGGGETAKRRSFNEEAGKPKHANET